MALRHGPEVDSVRASRGYNPAMPYSVTLWPITTPVGAGSRSVTVPLRQDPGRMATCGPGT